MKHLRLFEAFTQEQYNKAFTHIKSMLTSDAPKEDILKYVNSFTGTSTKQLNELRLTIQRVQRELNSRYSHILSYNKKVKTSRKRKDGSDWSGSRKAGDSVNRETFDYVRYYAFSSKKGNRTQSSQDLLRSIVDHNKNLYQQIIPQLNDEEIELIKWLCDRFFEIVDWIVETGPQKWEIMHGGDWYDRTPEEKKAGIEDLNDFDFENECEEINSLSKKITTRINNLI
jgi:hypothetical protein